MPAERYDAVAQALVELPGYTHLDLFFGRHADRDVYGPVVGAPQDGTSGLARR